MSRSVELKDILVVIGAFAYVVCPLDFDFIPGLGWIDDAAVVGWAMKYFANKKNTVPPPQHPHYQQPAHRQDEIIVAKSADDVIDVDWRKVR